MSAENAIAGAPALLFRAVEWGVVPATMLWLAFRWVLWGPVRGDGLRARSKSERQAALDGTLAGVAVAISAFLVFYVTGHPTPMGAERPIEKTLAFSSETGILFLTGFLLVAAQRLLWRKLTANNMWAPWFQRSEIALTTTVACCLGIVSLICYFEWKESHGPLFMAFSGLLIGYRALKVTERPS